MTTPPTFETVTPEDPLENLLHQAFARELAQPVDQFLMDRITRQIAWQQKVRVGVLSTLLLFGLVFCSLVLLPALTELAGAFTLPALPVFSTASSSFVGLSIIAVVFAPWLFTLVDDPI